MCIVLACMVIIKGEVDRSVLSTTVIFLLVHLANDWLLISLHNKDFCLSCVQGAHSIASFYSCRTLNELDIGCLGWKGLASLLYFLQLQLSPHNFLHHNHHFNQLEATCSLWAPCCNTKQMSLGHRHLSLEDWTDRLAIKVKHETCKDPAHCYNIHCNIQVA